MATFAQRLKELRLEMHLTQQELADIFFLNKSSISRYEQGKQMPEIDLLQKFASFFNVSVDYLLGLSDERIPLQENRSLGKEAKGMSSQKGNPPKLTRKDEREIEKILDEVRKQLENAEGLMFDGEPASPEAIQSIIDSMRIGLEIAKQRNKQKYTPKKYRKNKKEVGESE